MRIDLRSGNLPVSQEHLYRLEITRLLVNIRREGMTQKMRCDPSIYSSLLLRPLDASNLVFS
jgi:hypothetical protein